MKSNPPTLVLETVTGSENPPAPSPSLSTLEKIVSGPSPLPESWNDTITCPRGPMAIFPKFGVTLEGTFGTDCGEEKEPTAPRPVTEAPDASRSPLFHTTHTVPAPTPSLRW